MLFLGFISGESIQFPGELAKTWKNPGSLTSTQTDTVHVKHILERLLSPTQNAPVGCSVLTKGLSNQKPCHYVKIHLCILISLRIWANGHVHFDMATWVDPMENIYIYIYIYGRVRETLLKEMGWFGQLIPFMNTVSKERIGTYNFWTHLQQSFERTYRNVIGTYRNV